jgi:hypothetical protein
MDGWMDDTNKDSQLMPGCLGRYDEMMVLCGCCHEEPRSHAGFILMRSVIMKCHSGSGCIKLFIFVSRRLF